MLHFRSYKRALHSYAFPQFLTPKTTPVEVDFHDKKTRRQLLTTLLPTGECAAKIIQRQSQMQQQDFPLIDDENTDTQPSLQDTRCNLSLQLSQEMDRHDLPICENEESVRNSDLGPISLKDLN